MKFKRLAFVLFLAAVLAAFLRTFVFETIRVVTPAMSQSQPVGNRLIVEKWTLGARLPLSIGIPFAPDALLGINTYFRTLRKPYRFLGFSTLRRNDLVAFNSPMTDSKPIDRHPILLSRCIGLPGEYILVQGPAIFINDEEIQRPVDVSNCYSYPGNSQQNVLKLLKSCNIQQKTYLEKDSGYVYLTRYEYSTLSRQPEADSLGLLPYASAFDQKTAVIPYKGYRIELNARSFRLWGELINRYE
jgi:signal peptidase I